MNGLSGKWHLRQSPEELGFDWASYFYSNGAYYDREVIHLGDTIYPKIHVDQFGVQQSIAFLEQCVQDGNSFFLFHCPQTPHMNGQLIWDAKDSTKLIYDVSKMPSTENRLDPLTTKPEYLREVQNLIQAKKYGYPYPDSLAIQNHTRDYYAVISELDHFLGDLFEKVEELGLLDNAYIVFISDNGWMLGDHGFTSKVLPYKSSTHVPLWKYGPGIEAGVSSALVSSIDILPTV